MPTRALVTLLALAAVPVAGLVQAEPQGQNCKLETPPLNAGESHVSVANTQTTLKVFPRLSEITRTYAGCQVAWITINSGKEQILKIEMRDGDAIAVWPLSPHEPMCRKGESSKRTGCVYPAHFLGASAFPGCIARVQRDQMPQDCLQELFREMDVHQSLIDRAESKNAP